MLPSFETQRLVVRPRRIGDLNSCLAMDRDPAVLRYIDTPWSNPQEHRQFVINRITRAYPAGLGYWSVVLKLVPAAFVGWVLLIPYDAVGPEIERSASPFRAMDSRSRSPGSIRSRSAGITCPFIAR